MKSTTIFIISFFLLIQTSSAQDSVQVITSWIQQNTIPIKHIEAGNDYSDLQPLKHILKDVKVVGLGEATHGTREFFQFKHRLLEFLVREMNFTAFVMESSYSGCQSINEYILSGKGDRATVLTNQGYTAWDTEEFSVMLDWLRAYNQTVPDEKKVRFYGNDVGFNEVGRQRVLAYLQKHAPEKVTATTAFFKILAAEEDRWPSRVLQSNLQEAFVPLHDLNSFLKENKDHLVSVSSADEWEKISKHTQVMEQWVLANLHETPPSLPTEKLGRNHCMSQNFNYIIEKEKPDTKFIYWAHDHHVSNFAEGETVGAHLRQMFGEQYYAIGLECGQGTFQAREQQPDNFWGDLKIDTIKLVENSISLYFSDFQDKNLFIDLRPASSDPIGKKWLETSITLGSGIWMSRNSDKNHWVRTLKGIFDGIIFIEHSTPVQPTKNALYRSANRIGF